jgi:hypothetical protein
MRRLIPIVALAAGMGTANLLHAQARATERPALPNDSAAVARKYTQWFLAGMADSLVAHMDSANRAAVGGLEGMRRQVDQFALRAGAETEHMLEKWILRRGRTQYWYQSKFSLAPEPVVIRWVLEPDGRIAGIGLGLLSGAPPADPE